MDRPHRYRFVIQEKYTPETLPVARLAEYMSKMATLLGEKSRVHFVRMQGGSAALVQEVEPEAHATVRERIHAMRENAGPPDARQAYEALNGLLVNDRTSGYLSDDDAPQASGARLLEFPGAARDGGVDYGPFTEISELQGMVIRVGGELNEVPVHLKDGKVVHICHARRDLGTNAGHAHLRPSPAGGG